MIQQTGNIGHSSEILQLMRARHAFSPRSSAVSAQTQAPQEATGLNRALANRETETAGVTGGKIPFHQVDCSEIQQVAAKAGFVGVNPSTIQQAYYRGESLLVDYRV